MKNKKLKNQLLIPIFIVMTITTLGNIWLTNSTLKRQGQSEIKEFEKRELEKAKEKLIDVTDLVFSKFDAVETELNNSDAIEKNVLDKFSEELRVLSNLFEEHYNARLDAGKTKEEAFESAKKMLDSYNIDGNYLFMVTAKNNEPVALYHQASPQLVGKPLVGDAFNVGEGKRNFLLNMYNGAKESGSHVERYNWKGENKAALSYYLEDIDAVLGTGLVLDNLEEKAKSDLLRDVSKMFYADKSGYFFVTDNSTPYPTMLMHPTSPALNGKVMDDAKYNIAEGEEKHLWKAVSKLSKKKGEGFIKYYWEKPGEEEAQPKLSYIRTYKKWNYVVGTGFYIDDIYKEIEKKSAALNYNIKISIIRTATVSVVTLLIIWITIFILATKVVEKPIKELNDILRDISMGEGDLTKKIPVNSQDEIGHLARDFNIFVEKLNSLIRGVKETVDYVVIDTNKVTDKVIEVINGSADAEGIISLKNKVGEVLDNVRDQTASTEESLAALEQINAAAEMNNDNINVILGNSDSAIKSSEEGLTKVEDMTNGINNINKSVNNVETTINSLVDLSNDIGNILTAINSLSEQTNLLALNAAIEAARAGEAGRGFSVVADEIRKLAEKTNEETVKIEDIITKIQFDIDSVKRGNNLVEEDVAKVQELVTSLTSSIINITQGISNNNHEIEGISNSIEEQARSVNEITQATETISNKSTQIEGLSMDNNSIAESVVSAMDETLEIINSLKDKTDTLGQSVKGFKLD